MLERVAARLWSSAWILLVLVNLFWAGNIVVGRAVAGQVPPVTLAFWRWTGAFVLGLALAWPHLRRDWPQLVLQWRLMLVLAFTGIATYNTMCYIGLQYTTAINVLLLQSVIPVVILVWAYALFGERPSAAQALGIAVSLTGVAAIASGGSLDTLLHLSLNRGDAWILVALVINSVYAPLLRRRPPVHPMSFLVAAMGLGVAMMLPAYAWELAQGAVIRAGWTSWAALAYTAVLPSFVAYLFFNRAIELIGSARAGQSVHLMPLMGIMLAVGFLGERFYAYHAAGIMLIGAGIFLAARRRGAAA